jgi:hypothetical protein
MSTSELTRHVRYVIDENGQRSAVQIDLEVWDQLLVYLADLEAVRALSEMPDTIRQADAWAGLLYFAQTAQPGLLKDASENHDKYLYGVEDASDLH